MFCFQFAAAVTKTQIESCIVQLISPFVDSMQQQKMLAKFALLTFRDSEMLKRAKLYWNFQLVKICETFVLKSKLHDISQSKFLV